MNQQTRAWAFFLIAAFLMLLPSSAVTHQFEIGSITILEPWTRATPGPAKAGVGYMTIINSGGDDDRLLGAESTLSKRTELHTHIMDGTVMKMVHLEDGVVLPANSKVMLEPSGLHIMFMGLNSPFKEGEMLPVTLYFEKAGNIEVELAVKGVGAKSGGKMKHNH